MMNLSNKLDGYNKNLNEQVDILFEIIKQSKKIMKILKILEKYSLENNSFKNYYLSAGCINQTVFNYISGYDLDYGIGDYDIVYYDFDTSYEAEDVIIKELKDRLNSLNINCDIKNEKRVPIWMKENYGIVREDYLSVEDAIRRWTTTITCIGVRLNKRKLEVCAPYGLNDLFGMILRPVKIDVTEKFYLEKCYKWKSKWDKLTITEWEIC